MGWAGFKFHIPDWLRSQGAEAVRAATAAAGSAALGSLGPAGAAVGAFLGTGLGSLA